MTTLPTYFIAHGGGPWPWVPDMRRAFAKLEASLRNLPDDLPEQPKAVLMISGHWEEQDAFTVMHSPNPPMLYDYYNFPPNTYQVKYPAPGAPALAERVADLIEAAGLPARFDDTRGYDHGAFVPMSILWPNADMPLIQLSMRSNYSPAEHIALGRALAPLRDEGVLIIGSGYSFHNLAAFGPDAQTPSKAFDTWLNDTLSLAPEARSAQMIDWEAAPYSRFCHKEEDHLVPIFAALGAAETDPATRIYTEDMVFGGVTASSWRFG